MRTSKLREVSDSDFAALVARLDSIKDIQSALGYRPSSGIIFYQIRDRINELKIDVGHFGKRSLLVIAAKSTKHQLSDVLVANSAYKNINRLKKRIVVAGLIDYHCDICGNLGSWNGAPLSLQLDHQNGDPSDHRLKNLRFLCPNCHSQTHNFCGRNKALNGSMGER